MHDQQDRGVDPNQVVDEGKTVEGAVAKGAERLGVPLDEVEYDVLDQGSQGVFGLIGTKPAKVVVRRKGEAAADEVCAKVDEMVTRIMGLMGMSAQVRTRLEDDIHRVEIETADADGLLIGKKGESLDDLGHLLRRMVGKQLKRSVRMDVDVGGYKKRRGSALASKALSLAGRAKATGKDVQMEPLAAAERRMVHLALTDDPEVTTHTIGDGDLRTVVISPAKRGPRESGGTAGGGGAGRRGGRGGPRRGGRDRSRFAGGGPRRGSSRGPGGHAGRAEPPGDGGAERAQDDNFGNLRDGGARDAGERDWNAR